MPRAGDKVLVDWTGVTIGYQGRYFQTRNKPKGGAFADSGFDVDYLVFSVGDGSVIPAIDECVQTMSEGGIRACVGLQRALPKVRASQGRAFECCRSSAVVLAGRIVVPAEIGYPKDGFKTVGPKPSTFSGERALDFVLSSRADLMDKTLMFDIKLVRVNRR